MPQRTLGGLIDSLESQYFSFPNQMTRVAWLWATSLFAVIIDVILIFFWLPVPYSGAENDHQYTQIIDTPKTPDAKNSQNHSSRKNQLAQVGDKQSKDDGLVPDFKSDWRSVKVNLPMKRLGRLSELLQEDLRLSDRAALALGVSNDKRLKLDIIVKQYLSQVGAYEAESAVVKALANGESYIELNFNSRTAEMSEKAINESKAILGEEGGALFGNLLIKPLMGFPGLCGAMQLSVVEIQQNGEAHHNLQVLYPKPDGSVMFSYELPFQGGALIASPERARFGALLEKHFNWISTQNK